MKNLMKFCLVFTFVLAANFCFSQEKQDSNKAVKKTEMNNTKVNSSIDVKDSKTKPHSSKGKKTGITNKIAISDHGLPNEKPNTKKSTDKDKAVAPKK
jgi:hypothetical protein